MTSVEYLVEEALRLMLLDLVGQVLRVRVRNGRIKPAVVHVQSGRGQLLGQEEGRPGPVLSVDLVGGTR